MANELDYVENGYPLTVQFLGTNVALSSTVDLILDQSGVGIVVPTGYKAHATYLSASASAALATAATVTFKVTDDGTELAAGPEPQLTDSARSAAAVARVGAQPIAAGSVVAVSATTNSTGTSATDYDAVLSLIFTPA